MNTIIKSIESFFSIRQMCDFFWKGLIYLNIVFTNGQDGRLDINTLSGMLKSKVILLTMTRGF